MRSSSTLIKKISVPILEVKKNWIDRRFKIFFAYWKEIRAKQGADKQVKFVPNIVGGSRREHNHSKQKHYIVNNISFPWKLAI